MSFHGGLLGIIIGTIIFSKKNNFDKLVLLDVVSCVAPVGIFCLISRTFATQGLDSIFELAKYFFVVAFALFLHVCMHAAQTTWVNGRQRRKVAKTIEVKVI